jgi:NAD(P)-dependent dehydrogenase (short-subunit alcohol dehydrogenase family)
MDVRVVSLHASGGVHSPLDWPEDEWDKLIKTNLTGLWLVAKHVCRRMRDAKIKGSVINISSVSGLNRGNLPGSIGYASSKSAVHSVTKVMSLLPVKGVSNYCACNKLYLICWCSSWLWNWERMEFE